MSTSTERISRRVVHRGRIFELGVERVRLPNGIETELEVIQHPGAAAVVPVDHRGEVLLIRQYRHAVGGMLWEIPAGTLHAGEDPQACAARELVEETGVSAGRLEALGSVVPVPGYSTERIHLFAAFDLAPARQNLDEDEHITEVRAFSVESLRAMIASGELTDAKSVVALSRALFKGVLGDPGATSDAVARKVGGERGGA